MNTFSLKKFVKSLSAVAILMLVGAVVFQVGVAFGWTSPTGNPPTGAGALSFSAPNVGINTPTPTTGMLVVNAPGSVGIDVDPSGAASGQIIGLRALPTAADEAASKAYVDAQAFGGGGKPMITIWGHTNTMNPPNQNSISAWAQFWVYNPFTATIKNCIAGGVNCGNGWLYANVAAGGHLTCPVVSGQQWQTVYSGYGPYVYLDERYFYKLPSAYNGGAVRSGDDENPSSPDGDLIPTNHLPASRIGVTYSICGQDEYMVAQHNYSVYDVNQPGNNGVGEYAGVLSACMPQAGNVVVCNVCKICMAP